MRVEIDIDNANDAGENYLTWAPVHATVRVVEPDGDDPVDVVLGNQDTTQGGQLEFSIQREDARAPTLSLTLPADGSAVEFHVAGDYPHASSENRDAVLTVSAAQDEATLTTKPVMVRIRKNANGLTAAERERFTTALAKLNDAGAGLFGDFRAMHRDDDALDQAHSNPGFLSWHRAYLLDLERELQKKDASVSLPYWRFDEPAPNIFTEGFLGRTVPGSTGTVRFDATNLLQHWETDSQPGIVRRPLFNVATGTALNARDQAATLLLGGAAAVFDSGPGSATFDRMEGNPHGRAHTSFLGFIQDAAIAPRDPLFFLLHCNVDRLWALWQWFNDRFDGSQPNTYFFQGTAASPGAILIGHNLDDTLWPWDHDTTAPRPPIAPRTPFPTVPTAPGPGAAPTVGDMIDYHGLLNAPLYAGFAYDDVPYGVAP
jgi:tyrosinase